MALESNCTGCTCSGLAFSFKDTPLPIVLDEPFSESDDERFLRIMQFVVDVLTRDHQVIIFSCHRQRHQWLAEQLNGAQKDRLLFCHRVKSETASPAVL